MKPVLRMYVQRLIKLSASNVFVHRDVVTDVSQKVAACDRVYADLCSSKLNIKVLGFAWGSYFLLRFCTNLRGKK